jgi:hypothetical protein
VRWIPAALLSIALGSASAVAGAPGAPPPQLERAQALIREGRAEQAWQLLAPLQKQYAGQPDFDLALAMAATDSGRPNLATFALERLIVVQPGNANARLELVRALYALRDYERAERELQFILEAEPPPEVRALVLQYRARMRNLSIAAAGWSGYAEAGFGYDSNANVASALGSVFVPSLGTELIVDAPFRRDGDGFSAINAGLEYVRPLSDGFAATLGADLQVRSYAELDTFDSRSADLRLGLYQRLDPRDGVQYTLRHNDYELDHEGYRRMQSAAAEWRRTLGDRARIAMAAQGFRLRYRQQDERANSSDILALAGSAAYVLDPAARSVGLAGLYVGSDNAVAGRADGDRRMYGATAGLQHGLAPRIEGYASIVVLYSRYEQENPDFAMRRRDRQLDLALGASWQVAQGWFLRPQIAYTRNGSNIAVNEYRRTEAWLSLRRAWD